MSRIHKVVVYEEGVAVCEDELGKFLFERANVKIVPLSEPKRCWLTGSHLQSSDTRRDLKLELEVA